MTDIVDGQEIRTRNTALIGAMVESAVDGIVVINERGAIKMMNPAAERLFGYHIHEVFGQNISLLMPEPYRSQHDRYISNYLRPGYARSSASAGKSSVGVRTVAPFRCICRWAKSVWAIAACLPVSSRI